MTRNRPTSVDGVNTLCVFFVVVANHVYLWISGYVSCVYTPINVRHLSICASTARYHQNILFGVELALHYSLLVLLSLCHRRRAAPTSLTPSYVARLFGAAPSDREDDAESSDSSDDDQDRAPKAARATGSTTIPDVAVFQVLAFWLGDAKTV